MSKQQSSHPLVTTLPAATIIGGISQQQKQQHNLL